LNPSKQIGKDGAKAGKDWESMFKAMETDPTKGKELDEAVATDPEGFNKFMNERGK